MLSRGWKWPLRVVAGGLSAVGVAALTLEAMLAVPVKMPTALPYIVAGVRQVNMSDLPEPHRFQARDGTSLAYHAYEPVAATSERIVVLVHGSSGGSHNMYAIGKAMAEAGLRAIAIDVRGHGLSGTRGDIGYFGQLDDDLADLVKHMRTSWPNGPLMLVGHSSGGGFALRTAGGANGNLFAGTVLIAPYLGPYAPTTRPSSGDAHWAEPDMPRIIALTILRRLGLACCEHLPTVAFALPDASEQRATRRYSFGLMTNFGSGLDHHVPLNAVRHPLTVVAGEKDEQMDASRYAEAMRRPGLDVKTVIVPGAGHMDILATPAGIAAIVDAVKAQATM